MKLGLILAVLLAWVGPVLAHEPAMGVLELREVRPGTYVAGWTLEPTIGAEKVRVIFPSQCHFELPSLECGPGGLVGRVSIDNLGADMSAVLLRVVPIGDEPHSYTLTTASPNVSILGVGKPTWQTWREIGMTYLNVGIDHILLGIDHLLFVLGLIFVVGGGWRLVKTITAFTVGHSVSLAAAAYAIIRVPEAPLNACIALSIVFVGVELVKQHRGQPGLMARYPWAIAFTFGLVHGIGFASALSALGIERALLLPALLSFNVGVELGQLAFVALVLLLRWCHRRLGATVGGWGELAPGYVIGTVAMFWFLGRMVRLLTPRLRIRMLKLLLAVFLLTLGSRPASAHIVSARLGDFYGGALHPLTGLADVVLWLALGMLAATQPPRWSRWIVIVFPAGLLAGFAVGLELGWTSDPMRIDAGLMIALGGLTAASFRLPGKLLIGLAFALALFRGMANASELDPSTNPTLFACGLAAAGYAAITLVVAAVTAFRRSGDGWQGVAVRAGGSWIAATGLMVGGYALSVS